VLDLGCGTGDLALAVARCGARAIGLDLSSGMLRVAVTRGADARWIRGDAGSVPLADGSVDAVVSGFALRNLIDLEQALSECARVLRPGGRLALLEVDAPRVSLLRLAHAFYFHRVVPLIGRILVERDAYAYLPASVVYLPGEDELAWLLAAAGFEAIAKTRLAAGVAQLVTANRATEAGR
jgi:demethylmenaquinone methyltransferase/2-methoxy-6-polyprenyl-1,4-benzoquinol methylase